MGALYIYTSENFRELFNNDNGGLACKLPSREDENVIGSIKFPENNLSPKAQIEWAKSFCERNKEYSYEIFTNSPFILEALDIYGNRSGFKIRAFNAVYDDIGGEPWIFEEGKHNALRNMLEAVDEIEFESYLVQKSHK